MTHLSDEAVAACADGVLAGHARARAGKHIAECAECADAVRAQREAAFVLRAAPAPELPGGLLDRLRGLPEVTPIDSPPTIVLPDGSAMLATSAPLGSITAQVPPVPEPPRRPGTMTRTPHWVAPLTATAAIVAVAGVLVGGAPAAANDTSAPGTGNVARTVQQRTGPAGDSMTPLFTADVLGPGER